MSRRLDWLLPAWLEDVNAFDQSMNEDMSTIGYTILFNTIIFAACVLFFSFYRQVDPKIFTPKVDMFPNKTLPRIPNDTLFGWITHLYNITEEQLIEKGGYDQLYLIRFYKLSLKIIACYSIYAFAVLLPINRTGNANSNANSFEIWSMTNIPQGSERCWYHLIGVYILTGITIYFLEKEFVTYAKHRHNYLRQRHARFRTVLVEGIPHKMRSNVTLATYFEALYPNAVLCVRLAQDIRYLDRLVEEREYTVAKLERFIYLHHRSNVRPTIRVGNMLGPLDAIKYYSQLVDSLNDAVAKEQVNAYRLALKEDKSSGTTAINVIEEFLAVTEIGSIRKLLKEKSGNSKKWMKSRSAKVNEANGYGTTDDRSSSTTTQSSSISYLSYQANEYGVIVPVDNTETINDSSVLSKEFDLISTDDNGPIHPSSQFPFIFYKMTYAEWLFKIWTSQTFSDAWRVFKDGREGERHNSNASLTNEKSEEKVSLIAPPEERKMFLSKAFITFKTFTAATIARQVIHMQLADHLAVSEAPEPTDILWNNLYTTRKSVFYRRLFVEMAVVLLNIVWVAPVTLVSFVVSEEALRSYFPFVDRWCSKNDWFQSAVELIQPGALVSLMYALPPILNGLGILEGYVSYSAIQFRSFDRYFFFQIINVFLVTTISGSVIDCVHEIYLDPASAFELLGSSLPKMGAFFTNYILMKAFTGLGMELMRFAAICMAIMKQFLSSNLTPRERRATPLLGAIRILASPGWFGYSKIFAQDLLQVVVLFNYASISPLILVAGMCYFGLATFIYKHQMLYVYEPIYETGGKWWPKLARCFVVALLLAQATMIGMMILKETYREVYLLGILFFVTLLYYWNMTKTYVPLANQLPFDMATSMDLDQPNEREEEIDLAVIESYVQPSLRAKSVYPDIEFQYDLRAPVRV